MSVGGGIILLHKSIDWKSWANGRFSAKLKTVDYKGFFSELVAGQHADAQESWRTGRAELEPLLKEQPDNYFTLTELALTETGLGNKAAALDLAQRAIAVLPTEHDAFQGPGDDGESRLRNCPGGRTRPGHCASPEAARNSIRRSAQWRTDASH